MPRVIFNIGEAFPASDPVARFVTVLAMVSNDANRAIDDPLTRPRADPPPSADDDHAQAASPTSRKEASQACSSSG
jgi:hypothetical protein